jgi:outer membrane protein, heavy metal efflux system
MKINFLLLLFIIGAFNLSADDDSVLLEGYVKKALESNTQLLSSSLASQASEYDADIKSALPDPALMIEGRGIPMDLSRFGETRELMIMLEQMFPPAGSLKRLKEKGEFAADVNAEMLRAVKNDIRRQVKVAYYQLSYLDAAVATNREHLKLLDQFESIIMSKYVVAKAGQQDIFQIKIEIARLKTERLSLEEKRSTKAAELNQLLNKRLENKIPTLAIEAPASTHKIAMLDSSLEKWNPFLRAANIRIKSSKNDVRLARANKLPSVKVMGGYMAMNNANDVLMGRVGLTLPFMPWSSKDTRAALEKAHVNQNKADADYITLRDKLSVKLIASKNALYALYDQIDFYETQIVPAAEETVSLSVIGYQADTIDFLSLVQYARELLNHKLRADFLTAELQQQLAQLENVVGTKLNEVIK